MCDNDVIQDIPSGYGYKQIKSKCGNASIHGTTLLCDRCEVAQQERYPQGWQDTPGDTCPHGTYIGEPSGHDMLCGMCEMGID